MVHIHDVLIPLRFLALLGHFLCTVIALFAVRDSVVVALPFTYTSAQMETGLVSARWALWLLLIFLSVNAVSFFCGFSTFDRALSLFHLIFHAVGATLLGLVVINKAHYLYFWYILLIFSGPQVLCDAFSITSTILRGRRK